jgi:hypothetical protein
MRRPLIGRKDFNTSIGQGEQTQGGVKESYQGGRIHVFFFRKKKEENECGREELILMCEKMLFMDKKNYVQTKSMEGSCV